MRFILTYLLTGVWEDLKSSLDALEKRINSFPYRECKLYFPDVQPVTQSLYWDISPIIAAL
jgi:hypothetical protein